MKRKYLKGLMALALSGCFIFSQSVGVLTSYAATDENGNEYVEVNETNFPDTIFRNFVTSNIDIDRDGTGWWYEDNGWYPSNQYLWIDGVKYWFDSTGYMK